MTIAKKNTIITINILNLLSFMSLFVPFNQSFTGFELLFEDSTFQIMGLMLMFTYIYDLVLLVSVSYFNSSKINNVAKLGAVATIIFTILPIFSLLNTISYDVNSYTYGFFMMVFYSIIALAFRADKLFYSVNEKSIVGIKPLVNLLYIVPILSYIALGILNATINMSFITLSGMAYFMAAIYYLFICIYRFVIKTTVLNNVLYKIIPIVFILGVLLIAIINQVWLLEEYFVFIVIGILLFIINEVLRMFVFEKNEKLQ